MKTCEGCCFIFVENHGGIDHQFCRGAPPTVVVKPVVNGGVPGVEIASHFPPIPRFRCGLYRKRWPETARV